jgi:prepilin-type N-terminal cleavage/methylation domain-containing protein
MPTPLSRSTPRRRALRRAHFACACGFTLIEVLVVITISAILLAVGVPMFNSTIASMRASEGANSLVASLELARVEALRRGTNVTLCRVDAATATGCSTAAVGTYAGNDWAAGWMVWADVPNPTGAADVADSIDDNDRIQYQQTLATGSGPRVQIIDPNGATAIIFRPDGLSNVGGAQINFRVAFPQAAQGAAVSCRRVAVDVSGRTSTTRITC